MRNLNSRLLALGSTLLATLALAQSAEAQEAQTTNVDLPKFNPSFAGDRFFGVASPYAASDGTFNIHGGILVDYAHNPLVLASANDTNLSCGETECSIVENQLFLHLNVTGVLFDRIALNVDMPFALFESGEGNVSGGNFQFTSPDGPALGDLRIGARVRLLGDYFDAFQLGLGGYVWAPIGTDGAYTTDGSVRGQPHVLVGGRADRFIWSFQAGPTLRASTTIGNVTNGHSMNLGAGVGVLVLENRALQLGLESTAQIDMEDPVLRNTNAEALLGLKYRIAKVIEIGAGAGPGFTTGVGTPDVRAVFSLQYTPEMTEDKDSDGDGILDRDDACPTVKGVANEDKSKHGCPPPSDKDGDGIFDDVDACIDVPGVANEDKTKHGCPPPGDKDGDGITDDVDACVDVPGVPNEDKTKHGCPPPSDKDKDGIIDAEDACVDLAGVKTNDPKTNGCPPDTDGDGVRDDKDACVKQPGPASNDPKTNGCPKVFKSETEIVILEQVQFDTGKATIKPVSDQLLDSVAQVLKENPEVKKLEVQGHTDIRGSRQSNLLLSTARAKAVLDALVKRGIDKGRMTSKGYGPDKPLDSANNEAAWQKNRRVQFVILEKDASSTTVKTK